MKLSTQGKSSHKDVTTRPPGPVPGRYHVVLQESNQIQPTGKDPQAVVEFHVLKGTTPGQEGTIHSAFLYVNDKPMNVAKLVKLAMVVGLMGPNEDIDVDDFGAFFSRAKGRQLVIEIFEDRWEEDDPDSPTKKKPRTALKIGSTGKDKKSMGMWPIGDPDVADVPLDQAMLAAAASGPPAHAVPAPAPTNGTPAAATAAAGADWDV